MRRRRSNGWVFQRGRSWYAGYFADGCKVREVAGPRKADAVALLQTRIRELDDGRWQPPGKPLNFSDLMELVKNDYRAQERRSWPRVETSLKHLQPAFGRAEVAAITAPRLARYANDRLEAGAAVSTVRNELNVLKRGMNLAVRAGLLSHCPAFPTLRPTTVRTGFFERSELDAVCSALPEWVRPVVRFLYLTGWRRGEALSREWRHVDFAAGTIRLEPGETKNGQGRVFPFGALPELAALLDERRAYTDAVERRTGQIVRSVFHHDGRPIKSFRTAWRAACRRIGLARIPHDFRRTAVRNLVRAGVPEKAAMALTGHLTRSVFDRYCIVNEADLREAVGKLASAMPDNGILALPDPNRTQKVARG